MEVFKGIKFLILSTHKIIITLTITIFNKDFMNNNIARVGKIYLLKTFGKNGLIQPGRSNNLDGFSRSRTTVSNLHNFSPDNFPAIAAV